jgi:ribonuclease HI
MDPNKWSTSKRAVLAHHHVVDYDWGILLDGEFILYPSISLNELLSFLFNENDVSHQASGQRLPIICYTDGSGTTAKKPAGIGVAIYQKSSSPIFIAENIGLGTNNVAELRAIWRVLKQFPDRNQELQIYSDSEYAIGSLTLDWSPQINVELIRCIREDLSLRPNIHILWVEGHAGVEGNEVANDLANIGRKRIKTVSL